jgi:cysteine desulfurase
MKLPIYLDYAASTPVDPRVAELMMSYLTLAGNPASSTHAFGKAAKDAVGIAREQIAALLHAHPEEIIWTSGATESINLAIKGIAQLYQRKGRHIVTMKTEHKAVLDTCQQLEKEGYSVTYLSPEPNGLLDAEKFKAALREDTILAAIMHVNNETGVIQNIHQLANITAERGVLLHVDAAQSNGKLALDVTQLPVDLISLSAHKIYGPKGVGALYLRRKPRVRVAAQIHGGGQQQGMRSGTLPTHQIVGMGEAFHLAGLEMADDYKKSSLLRTLLLEKISTLENLSINGDLDHTYPGILNMSFAGIKADQLIKNLPDLAIAVGSACLSGSVEPSYVLRAMGLFTEQAETAIRLSYGRFTTIEEIDFAADKILDLNDWQ